jgi:hypothetical protein
MSLLTIVGIRRDIPRNLRKVKFVHIDRRRHIVIGPSIPANRREVGSVLVSIAAKVASSQLGPGCRFIASSQREPHCKAASQALISVVETCQDKGLARLLLVTQGS